MASQSSNTFSSFKKVLSHASHTSGRALHLQRNVRPTEPAGLSPNGDHSPHKYSNLARNGFPVIGTNAPLIAQYEVLSRLMPTVSSCGPEDVARLLSDLLSPLVDFDCLDVIALDEEKGNVLWHAVVGGPLSPQVVPFEETTAWWVHQNQQPLLIQDWKRDERFAIHREALKSHGFEYRSLYRLPLRTTHGRLGVFSVSSLRPNAFSDDDVHFLLSVADHLALAMAHTTSLERSRKALSELEIKNARLELAMAVTNRASSSRELSDVLMEAVTNVRQALDSDLALAAVFDPEACRLRIEAIDAPNSCAVLDEDTRFVLAGDLDSLVEHGDKPWTGHTDCLSEIVAALGLENGNSVEACVVPINARRQALGFVALAREARCFTDDEVAFVSHVATQLALAIEIALVNDEMQRLRQDFSYEKVDLGDEIRSETNFEEIVGTSAALSQVLREVEIVAPTDSGVLILGETGTGKELIAQAIHNRSSRRQQPFVKVNCAAIPSGLLESELFGHEKGAFTGAIMRKAGRFEVADKGTLFLDEVGDIPLELQPKLLRILQEREFERLGSTRTQQVDVRVVAATHRDLKKMVDEGQFRSDLYYRLKVFPLTVPPLRDRAEDIPILVRYYVDKYARRLNRKIEDIPVLAMRIFCRHPWFGNVRELQNFIERAVILSPGPVLRAPISELKQEIDQANNSKLGTLEEVEREHVSRAIRESNWVIGGPNGAAARLGMKRTTLAYRIRKLNIPTRPQ